MLILERGLERCVVGKVGNSSPSTQGKRSLVSSRRAGFGNRETKKAFDGKHGSSRLSKTRSYECYSSMPSSFSSSSGIDAVAKDGKRNEAEESIDTDRRKALAVMGSYPLLVLSGMIGTWSVGGESSAADMGESGMETGAPIGQNAQRYVDEQDGFSMDIPEGWQRGTGNLGNGPAEGSRMAVYSNAAGMQRVVAFFPEDSPGKASLAVTVKTLSADYTGMGSFGSALDFGTSLVASMDRSYLLRGRGAEAKNKEGVTIAKLIDAKESSGKYFITYDVGQYGQPTRRVVTAVSVGTAPNGFRRFFTVNGSCVENDLDKYGNLIENAVKSFKCPAL